MAVGTLALVAALLLVLLIPSGRSEAQGFDGATRSDIPVEPFTLHDQHGNAVSSASYKGRVTIVTFLYTTCTDTCPLLAQQIGIGMDRLGHDVPVLAISVDPAHDTAELARRFLDQRLLGKRIEFLLGTPDQLQPIWRNFGIRPVLKGPDGADHSAYVILLDKAGRQRVAFPADRLTPEGLAHDVKMLEAEPAPAA
jgi:protein SCO1/2